MDKDSKKKILLIIDPQFDFVRGSLKVNDAIKIMQRLRNFIENFYQYYDRIIITKDWHPKNHISFKEWPMHCVAHSKGSEICDELCDIITDERFKTTVLTKGTGRDTEEYSIMQNYISGLCIKRLMSFEEIEAVDVCGIAGDFCVYETVKDLIPIAKEFKKHINVLFPYIAFIEDKEKLNNLIEENQSIVSKIS